MTTSDIATRQTDERALTTGDSATYDGAAALTPGDLLHQVIPIGTDKDTRHRLGKFTRWLVRTGRDWTEPGLAQYRDELLDAGLSPASVAAHLSTIRGRYRDLTTDNQVRDILRELARAQLIADGEADNPANRKALVDEALTRLENATDARRSQVTIEQHQDVADSEHLRLTRSQANSLLASPGVTTIRGLRDTAIIGLMLTTGIREQELVNLDVADLRQRLDGKLALHVRKGKGCKTRLIPYGGQDWVLAIVDKWLAAASIEAGPVFVAMLKGGRVRDARQDDAGQWQGRLTTRSIQKLLTRYPIAVDGQLVKVKSHDCRRTYAKLLHDAGVIPIAIQQNLGHADLRTTLLYIGDLGADKRQPPSILSFNLAELAHAPLQERLTT